MANTLLFAILNHATTVMGIPRESRAARFGISSHLGSIRSLATTVMVIATAIGPGITGLLIDRGTDFPTQSLFMGGWCFVLTIGCVLIDRRLTRELRLG